jgi:hypothetical protein
LRCIEDTPPDGFESEEANSIWWRRLVREMRNQAIAAQKEVVVEKRSPLESKGMAAGADSNQLKPRDRQ